MTLLHSKNEADHQCGFCHQIFNLPLHMDVTNDLLDRFDLVQSHFKGHCPVALQLSILFAAILHGGGCPNEQDRSESSSPMSKTDLNRPPALKEYVLEAFMMSIEAFKSFRRFHQDIWLIIFIICIKEFDQDL